MKKDYDLIVRKALGIANALDPFPNTIEEIARLFENEYNNARNDNPNFIGELGEAIQYFDFNPVRIARFKSADITRAYSIFLHQVAPSGRTESNEEILLGKNRLHWTGQKNQLYSVIRQLKEKNLIANSYNALAEFLIKNVDGFENVTKDTIEKELKRNKPLPLSKRVNLEIEKENK